MHIPASLRERIPHTITESPAELGHRVHVGREDRAGAWLHRPEPGPAGGFTLIGSHSLNLVTLTFLLLGGYFALTAALGSDPGYHRAGIDTRTDAELAERSRRSPRRRRAPTWRCRIPRGRASHSSCRLIAEHSPASALHRRATAAHVGAMGYSPTRLPSGSQWPATFFDGCTRGGSPGIFG